MERMKITKFRFGILMLVALFAIVAVASAALPTSVDVTATFSNAPTSYWNIHIDSTVPIGNTELPTGGYAGWCSDINNYYTPSGPPYTFTPYSSLASVPAIIPSANWKAINYIINHKKGYDGLGTYDWQVIQAVMWHYDGYPTGYPTGGSITYDPTAYDALLADVQAHYASYTPGSGDVYAVILWQREHVQAVFVEAKVMTLFPHRQLRNSRLWLYLSA